MRLPVVGHAGRKRLEVTLDGAPPGDADSWRDVVDSLAKLLGTGDPAEVPVYGESLILRHAIASKDPRQAVAVDRGDGVDELVSPNAQRRFPRVPERAEAQVS
jgi:hypothetical protein